MRDPLNAPKRAQAIFKDNAERMLRDIMEHAQLLTFVYYPADHSYDIYNLPKGFGIAPLHVEDFPEGIFPYLHLSPEDEQLFRRTVKAVDEGAPCAECTVQIHVGGASAFITDRFITHFAEDGKPDYALVYGFDVTRPKIREQLFAEQIIENRMPARGEMICISCYNVTKDAVVRHGDSMRRTVPRGEKPCSDEMRAWILAAEPEAAKQNPQTQFIFLSSVSQVPDEQERRVFAHMCSRAGMLEAFQEGKTDQSYTYRRTVRGKLIWVTTRIVLLSHPDTQELYGFYYTEDVNTETENQRIIDSVLSQSYEYIALLDPQHDTTEFRFMSDTIRKFASNWDKGGPVSYSREIAYSISHSVPECSRQEAERITSLAHIVSALEKKPLVTNTLEILSMGRMYHKQIQYRWFDEAHTKILAMQQDISDAWDSEQAKLREEEEAERRAESLRLDNQILRRVGLEANDFIALLDLKTRRAELRYGTWFAADTPTPETMRALPAARIISAVQERYMEGEEADRFGKAFRAENLEAGLRDKSELLMAFNFTKGEPKPMRKM